MKNFVLFFLQCLGKIIIKKYKIKNLNVIIFDRSKRCKEQKRRGIYVLNKVKKNIASFEEQTY